MREKFFRTIANLIIKQPKTEVTGSFSVMPEKTSVITFSVLKPTSL